MIAPEAGVMGLPTEAHILVLDARCDATRAECTRLRLRAPIDGYRCHEAYRAWCRAKFERYGLARVADREDGGVQHRVAALNALAHSDLSDTERRLLRMLLAARAAAAETP